MKIKGENIQIQFTVPGRACPAVRTTQRQQFRDPYYAKYRDYKEYFATIALQELRKNPSFFCHQGSVVEFEAIVYLRGRRRIDIDNLLKGFFDACNKVLWDDDSQVVKAQVEKRSVRKIDNERVEVRVKRNE